MVLIGIDLNTQVRIFLLALVVGAILGFLYDIFRSIRLAVRTNKTSVLIQDIIYFVICAFVTFIFTLSVNNGEIRFYIIAGEIIGFIIYSVTVSKIFMKCAKFIIKSVKNMSSKVYIIALTPLILMFKEFFKKIYNFITNKRFGLKIIKTNKNRES